jgi:hypothetical protein
MASVLCTGAVSLNCVLAFVRTVGLRANHLLPDFAQRRGNLEPGCPLSKDTGSRQLPNFSIRKVHSDSTLRRRPQMSKKKPLKPEDFPVHSNQSEIVTDTGKPVAGARDKETAEDVADRLNSDHAREEEDRWA